MKPRVFLPAIVSGVLLWAAFFPLDLGPLAYVALAPWLTLVRAPVGAKRRYFAAYLGAFAFFLPAVNWMRVAHPMMYLSWLGLALVCPVFWCAGLWLVRRIDRLGYVPLAASVPVVWVALEYARAHFPTGYPFLTHVGLYQMVGFGWYFLGYTQHEFLPLIQIADLGGVYAVSFVVAAVNGLAAEWAMRSEVVRRWLRWEGELPRPSFARLVPASVAVVTVFAASVGYGLVRLDHPEFEPGPRVAAIQGSVPQFEKNKKGQSLGATYGALHLRALGEKPRPDLIIWPETCSPVDWYGLAPGTRWEDADNEFRRGLEWTEREFNTRVWNTYVLFGLNGKEWEGGREWKYNSAVLIGPRGEYGGRYDKMHLVPFGEYVPFRETLPFMNTFTPYDWEYSCRPGEHWTRFSIKTADGRAFTFGCLICYEDSDPYLARQYAGPHEPVNFLVNISNDGWFDGTEEHEQHLAICRFRAVEARRSVVRAVNMGISCVIDPDGRVIAWVAEPWGGSKKVEGVVSAVVPIDARESCYARLGDWVPGLSWAAIALGLVVSLVRGRRP
ncbi:MAG TPA: apolipoprotein N-acyltransferase [Gemmataceae bacterium]|nr:apolipoprotein N-acyltransferase [Gemmataceae bacterium]